MLLHLCTDYTFCKMRLVKFKYSDLFQPSIKQLLMGQKSTLVYCRHYKSAVTNTTSEETFYLRLKIYARKTTQ